MKALIGRRFAGIMLWLASASGQSAYACATCFGQSDSQLAEGMNMGILSLLGVVVTVLALVATFFISLARRAALYERTSENPQS